MTVPDLWESSPDERREATRELAQAQALVEDLAATYAGSGSELVLGVLIGGLRQHAVALVRYRQAFAPARAYGLPAPAE